MRKAFKVHLEQYFPELLTEYFLIGCSGGIDSMVLVHLCSELGLNFALAHCNFELRGQESDGDELFVRKTAETLGKEVFVRHFETARYAESHKISIQMAARELRYDWFSELLLEKGYAFMLTAHQANDGLETFIINLSRGTGLEGLKGIPKKNGSWRRPLLPFTRDEIHEYATSEQIAWREDSSNEETKYLRNRIRHHIIPELKKLSPAFLENFQRTQSHLEGTYSLLKNHIDTLRKKLFSEGDQWTQIRVADLKKLNPLNDYLYELFSPFGFTEWNNVKQLLDGSSGKELRSATHRLLKDREHLLLKPISKASSGSYQFPIHMNEIDRPIRLKLEEVVRIDDSSPAILYCDKETLNKQLTLRKWKRGDYFYPLGMKGRKLVSKFYKDCKMSTYEKEDQWLLCSGSEIVWIVGKRADDRFKVTPETRQILKFQTI